MQALGWLCLSQFLEGPCLELANAFPGKSERLPDLFEGMLLFTRKPIAQPQDQLFARRQGADQRSDTGSHSIIIDSTVGKRRALIGDEVFETLFCAGDVRLKRDGLSRKPVEGFEGVGV